MKSMSCIEGVYAITPVEDNSWRWVDIVEVCCAVLHGGVRILQMRQKDLNVLEYEKRALQLGVICKHYEATLILNDAPALAELCQWPGVRGVHLGQSDLSVDVARSLWGEGFLIGASCYNRFELAERAVNKGADHIAFGAVYPSVTKPAAVQAPIDLFERARPLGVPKVAIGGIQLDHLEELKQAGADAVAVVSALFGQQPDSIAAQTSAARWVQRWHLAGQP